jgi:hypothetical protein
VTPRYVFKAMSRAEYVLHDLYAEMCARGHDCVELVDFEQDDPRQALRALAGHPTVLVTSDHLAIGSADYEIGELRHARVPRRPFHSVIEALDILRPERAVFAPHDLVEPAIAGDLPYLNRFDLVLSPGPRWSSAFTGFARVEEVGWPRLSAATTSGPSLESVWFPSSIVAFEALGVARFAELFAPVARQVAAVKLPDWPGVDAFERVLQDMGAQVLPRTLSAAQAITRAELVVTNSDSSVSVEAAALGRPVVCVAFPNDPRARLSDWPEIIVIDDPRDLDLASLARDARPRPAELTPFALDRAVGLVSGAA